MVKTAKSVDVPFDYIPIATWTSIETNVLVVVACLMTMKPLLLRAWPNLLGSSGRLGGNNTSNNHVLTIGSKPLRAPLDPRGQPKNVENWNGLVERREVKDLEGQTAECGRNSADEIRRTNGDVTDIGRVYGRGSL